MELIVWREEFNTGVVKVDTQHKHLVSLINSLFNALGKPDKTIHMKTIFLELYGYTVNHFSMEEALMLEKNYDKYDLHKAEHLNFALKIDEFKSKYLANDATVTLELLNFLKDWLITHIIGTDKITFNELSNASNE